MMRLLCVGLLLMFAGLTGCTEGSQAVTPPQPSDPDEKLVPITRGGNDGAPRQRAERE